MIFYSFAIDLDPMTLVLKFYLDIVKIYVCTENEVSSFSDSKVLTLIDTQTLILTHGQTGLKILPTRIRVMVIIPLTGPLLFKWST